MRAAVKPDVLRWARESIGYDVATAAKRIGVRPEILHAAEDGRHLLTIRQAELAADMYDRPLAAMFLPAPLEEEPQQTQFRRLPGAPPPPWPPEMAKLVRRVRLRQEAAVELYDALDEAPPWPSARLELEGNLKSASRRTREVLGIALAEQASWNDKHAPLRHWVDAVEELGILVMQDGSLPVETMRGFASTHAEVPAIVVNTKDDPRARAFTVLHELGHLLLSLRSEAQSERWCETFAGEVLMPPEALRSAFSELRRSDPLETVDLVAARFSVTPMAAAVRCSLSELLSHDESTEIIAKIRQRTGPGGTGGDYYRIQIARLGPSYINLVFDALDSRAITFSSASSLLSGVKVNKFDRLRESLQQRAGAA
jgi:Zn-dependent peptidase ImmA (M78 family)